MLKRMNDDLGLYGEYERIENEGSGNIVVRNCRDDGCAPLYFEETQFIYDLEPDESKNMNYYAYELQAENEKEKKIIPYLIERILDIDRFRDFQSAYSKKDGNVFIIFNGVSLGGNNFKNEEKELFNIIDLINQKKLNFI